MSLMLNGTTHTETRLQANGRDQPREGMFDAEGVQLRYVTAGTGEPVLLLHGITRTIEVDWKEPGLFDALTEEFRVIALDQRGHGRSDKPDEKSSYGMEMVYDVIRLLDHLGLEAAHVIGYSMGGRIALKMVITDPTRLRSIVLAGSGGVRHPADLTLWNDLASSLEHGGGIQTLIRAIWPD